MTPPALDRVVKKCLAKEPEKRWQSASDLADELKWITESGSQVALLPGGPVVTSRKTRERLLTAVAGIALVAAGLLAALYFNRKLPAPPQVIRFQIRLPDKVSFGGGTGGYAFSRWTASGVFGDRSEAGSRRSGCRTWMHRRLESYPIRRRGPLCPHSFGRQTAGSWCSPVTARSFGRRTPLPEGR